MLSKDNKTKDLQRKVMQKTSKLKNKLSIFLLKDNLQTDEILKYVPTTSVDISPTKNFFWESGRGNTASWLKFFSRTGAYNKLKNDLKVLLPKGILIIKNVICGKEKKDFAITFGSGFHLLDPDAYVERFGLKVLLNIIDPQKIRKLSQKSMRGIPSDSVKQLSKLSSFEDFDIDIFQDFVVNLTATSNKDDETFFGKNITGGNSLSVSISNSLEDIDAFLEKCYEKYISEKYKENFSWIDNVRPETNSKKIKKLKENLINKIREGETKHIWMSIPEVLSWENINGFKFSKRGKLRDDIEFSDFMSEQVKDANLFDNTSLSKKVHVLDSNDYEIYNWKVLQCMYAEIEESGNTYILNSGKWFCVKEEYLRKVNWEYSEIIKNSKSYDLELPKCSVNEKEGSYNEKVGDGKNYFTLDKKLVRLNGYSAIEVCDLISTSERKEFIHVKKYGASSVFSHLFKQGTNSTDLFLHNREYREEINEKLPAEFSIELEHPDAREYKVIFAVISRDQNEKEMQIPFFSKISLSHTKKLLNDMGISNVYLKQIEIEKE